MAGRYTKSIPEFVYFIDGGDGWFAGPYVKNPMKDKNANTDALVICKIQVIPKLVSEPKKSMVERYGIKKENTENKNHDTENQFDYKQSFLEYLDEQQKLFDTLKANNEKFNKTFSKK